jgi:hypothetical protein
MVLTVNAPKEVRYRHYRGFDGFDIDIQIADVEGACQGLLGLDPF